MDKNIIGGIGSQYAKRKLETFYNFLDAAELLDNFKKLDPASQHILEFIAYFLTTKSGEQIEQQGGVFRKILGEIIKDAPSEIFKRIYNNQHSDAHSPAGPKDNGTFFSNLMDLKKDEMLAIIDELETLDGEKKKKMLQKIQEFSGDHLSKFAALTPAEKDRLANFIDTATPDSLSKKSEDAIGETLDEINAWLKTKL